MSNFLSSILSIFRGGNIADQLTPLGIHTTQDASTIQLKNQAGQKITLDQTSVIIQDTNGNVITLDAAGIHIQSSAKVNLDCAQLALSASQVTFNTALVKCSGVVQCDTLIANSVVGSSYALVQAIYGKGNHDRHALRTANRLHYGDRQTEKYSAPNITNG